MHDWTHSDPILGDNTWDPLTVMPDAVPADGTAPPSAPAARAALAARIPAEPGPFTHGRMPGRCGIDEQAGSMSPPPQPRVHPGVARRRRRAITLHPQGASLKPIGYNPSYLACGNMMFGPYLAATHRTLVPVMTGQQRLQAVAAAIGPIWQPQTGRSVPIWQPQIGRSVPIWQPHIVTGRRP
jgi:hypothetical protein